MNRLAAITLAIALGTAVTPAEAGSQLRGAITVTGPLVTLGDLFTDAGEAADIAVFQAPDPGTTGAVTASRVIAAAAAHGLATDPADIAKVDVTRESRVIEAHEVEQAVASAIAERIAADGDTEIKLDDPDPLHVEADAASPIEVSDLRFDPRTTRFSARITIPGSRTLSGGRQVTGRALQMVDLPILQRQVRRGETISPADVAFERMPLSAAPAGAVRQITDVVGMSARTALRAGAPVPADRLMEPILVGRNEPVTIIYRNAGLVLTVRGRSLGDGARGHLITVMNSQSKRTVEAVVSGPGQVVVQPPRQVVANAVASN
ncbi:flagellar basal body P-ring formation chaperone FlgA [Lutibaculum baratangense]|nr:flagellar basal body P-ring formation chaperone FlgA [Lutibaculum baratangense]